MSKLNRDVLYFIFESFQDDKKTLHTCLLINKTWCEIIVPILWRNPWKFLKKEKEKMLFNIIISHLSDELKNNLKIQSNNNNILINSYKRPLFNYIRFCRHLNLKYLDDMNDTIKEEFKISIENEIFNLFI